MKRLFGRRRSSPVGSAAGGRQFLVKDLMITVLPAENQAMDLLHKFADDCGPCTGSNSGCSGNSKCGSKSVDPDLLQDWLDPVIDPADLEVLRAPLNLALSKVDARERQLDRRSAPQSPAEARLLEQKLTAALEEVRSIQGTSEAQR
jgi:hypothetical protein